MIDAILKILRRSNDNNNHLQEAIKKLRFTSDLPPYFRSQSVKAPPPFFPTPLAVRAKTYVSEDFHVAFPLPVPFPNVQTKKSQKCKGKDNTK